DVRALLKAKRQESKINHPLAAYSPSGQLRCIACGTIVKNASAWTGHVGSKTHRVNVAKLKEEEARKAAEEEELAKFRGKRKAEDDSSDEEEVADEQAAVPKKRKVESTSPAPAEPGGGFPTDFFSDPSKAPPPPSPDDDDSEDEQMPASSTALPSQPPSAIDLEWEQFQKTVIAEAQSLPEDAKKDTYERATVFAEAVLSNDVPQGFPPRSGTGQSEVEAAVVEEEELTEEEIRRQKEQDERELIMDRLLDEERAQEEADAKVTMLKHRLDALRKKRQAAKNAK
ncbi:hypothetical protein C8Q75DRAFT_693619, partial [Abortiporus biennis]